MSSGDLSECQYQLDILLQAFFFSNNFENEKLKHTASLGGSVGWETR